MYPSVPSSPSPFAASPLRIALLGVGTVGAALAQWLVQHHALLASRAGRTLQLVAACARDRARAQARLQALGLDVPVWDDPVALASAPEVDVLVEVMGGTTLARSAVLSALASGRDVVTANKALLAEHGAEVFGCAQRHGRRLAYEAAVAVSIPIVRVLRDSLAGCPVQSITAVLNGTCNFILHRMEQQGLEFADALVQAQALGYAEADPTLDISGRDAAHKLSLLAALAWGGVPPLAQVRTQGIESLQLADVRAAQARGMCWRLVAQATCSMATQIGPKDNGAPVLDLQVTPVMLPRSHALAQLEGALNGVLVQAEGCGELYLRGAGAGGVQTASALVADLLDLARSMKP